MVHHQFISKAQCIIWTSLTYQVNVNMHVKLKWRAKSAIDKRRKYWAPPYLLFTSTSLTHKVESVKWGRDVLFRARAVYRQQRDWTRCVLRDESRKLSTEGGNFKKSYICFFKKTSTGGANSKNRRPKGQRTGEPEWYKFIFGYLV